MRTSLLLPAASLLVLVVPLAFPEASALRLPTCTVAYGVPDAYVGCCWDYLFCSVQTQTHTSARSISASGQPRDDTNTGDLLAGCTLAYGVSGGVSVTCPCLRRPCRLDEPASEALP
jgi:hypothetical protein